MAKIVKERDELRQLDKDRRKTLHEQRAAFEVQLRELEERLWGEVQDKLYETKRRENVEISEQAAVQELLRLRASMSLPPSAGPSALKSGGRGLEDFTVMYKRAQEDVRQQSAAQLEALVQELKECRQDLIRAQGGLADEVKTAQELGGGALMPAEDSGRNGQELHEALALSQSQVGELERSAAAKSDELRALQERVNAAAVQQSQQQQLLDELREAHSALLQKHDGLAQHKGALQAQILGINQEKDGLNAKIEALNKELGSIGAVNRELEAQVRESKADISQRLALIAAPHACQCIHRALEHLTEKGGSPSILASLSLALLALQDAAGPARNMVEIDTKQCMSLLARHVTQPAHGTLTQPCREALYAVALASTFSAGRKQIAEVADASLALALICQHGSEDDIKRWAGLALGCTLMVQHVRQHALDKDAGGSLVQAVTPLLEGGDSNAQSFACLALGNLAVEQAARNRFVLELACSMIFECFYPSLECCYLSCAALPFLRCSRHLIDMGDSAYSRLVSIIVHGKAAIGLCRCLSVPNLLTQRYAVGAIRNIAVSKRSVPFA
jgi:hypothetical protein